jgi:hypothetical protein
MMADDRPSPIHRMPNILWLMDNVDDRYRQMPTTNKRLAEMLGIKSPSGISQRLNGGTSTTTQQVQTFLVGSGLLVVHPEIQPSWFDWPPYRFILQMQAISFGRWRTSEPLDSLSSTQPALPNASVVRGDELAKHLGRGAQRSDLGVDIELDPSLPRGLVWIGSNFGIKLRDIEPAMMNAVAQGWTTSLLLIRRVLSPYFEAAPCPQDGCLHLVYRDFSAVTYPPARSRQHDVSLIVAKKPGEKQYQYGFSVPSRPDRIELLLAVFGYLEKPRHEITPLYEWSQAGGLGTPEQRQCLRQHLADAPTNRWPRIAGRMLVDVVPPSPPLR